MLISIRKLEDQIMNISIKYEDNEKWEKLKSFEKELSSFVNELKKKGIK